MKYDSMVIYRTWMETLDDLDNETAGEVIKMIMHYGMNGEDISDEMTPAARAIFKMSKGNIDASNKKRENGSKGGKQTQSKAKQTSSKHQANVKQTESKTQAPDKQPSSNINKDKDKDVNRDNNTSLSTKSASAARFSIFWQTYPKRVRQTDAEEEWEKLSVDSELFDRIIKALNVAKESDEWKRENGRFIPHPSNWLKDRRWEDEPVNVRAPAKKNKFANFHQRDRSQEDFDELEKQMLQRRTGHEEKSNQNNKDNKSNGDTPARAV